MGIGSGSREKIGYRRDALIRIAARVYETLSLEPVIGAELEFYCQKSAAFSQHLFATETEEAKFLAALLRKANECGAGLTEIEKERGEGQYEIQLPPGSPLFIADQLFTLRYLLREGVALQGLTLSFDAKPFLSPEKDQPGSALHIHLNFLDLTHNNCFAKQGEEESPLLLHAIGGMLALLPASMALFSPTASSYARFVPRQNAPTTISWGGNNRTVALRLPTADSQHRRIEHRVPAAGSCPYLVITAILLAAYEGIAQQITPPPRIYGEAWDPQYKLPPLPQSLEEAMALFRQDNALLSFFTPEERQMLLG